MAVVVVIVSRRDLHVIETDLVKVGVAYIHALREELVFATDKHF